jgi:hypothetical protein
MKEHITPKQAKEITKEQFFALFKNQHWECVDRKDYANYHHKKVTIGKMMAILVDTRWIIRITECTRGWQVELITNSGPDHSYADKELCDALWKAIKDHKLEEASSNVN